MAVVVSLPLFGNPGRELEEGMPVRGQQLRDLGRSLAERLAQAAELVDKLVADGWTVRTALFDVLLSHERVLTREEAIARLRKLEIDPEALVIIEELPEDETLE